jgi:predicted permease
MRTIPIPALALYLLTPVLALAQPGTEPTQDHLVFTSSAFWFWVIAFALAVVAFIWSYFVFSRRGRPPGGQSGSGWGRGG